jgi:hypothetical protein
MEGGEGCSFRSIGLQGPEEGIGKHAKHVLGPLVVLLAVLLSPGPLRGIVDEGVDALILLLQLGRTEGLAIPLHQLLYRALIRLHDLIDILSVGPTNRRTVSPAGVIGVVRDKLGVDSDFHQLLCIRVQMWLGRRV